MIEHYLSRQPSPEERVEVVVATIATMYRNAHMARGETPAKLTDYLPFLDPDWSERSPKVDLARYDEVDQSILKAMGAISR